MSSKSLKPLRLLAVNLVVLILCAGCATKKMELTRTGFLSDYSNLQEDEESKGMRVYKNPKVNIRSRYTKILIAPVQFKLDPAVEEKIMDEKDKEMLASYFLEQLKEGLSQSYVLADEPGWDVALLRTAITDILPNKVYLNLHWSTTLMGAGIGGASLEAELVDSLTGERVVAFVDGRKGKKLNYTKGLTKWGHTKEVLGLWADLMVNNLKSYDLEYFDYSKLD